MSRSVGVRGTVVTVPIQDGEDRDVGPVELRMPRDCQGTFEPVTVPKHVRRLDGLGANVISLYAKG